MTVALVLPDKWDPAALIPWSARFAEARDENLLILATQRRASETQTVVFKQPADVEDAALRTAIAQLSERFFWDSGDNEENHEESEASDDSPTRSLRVLLVKQANPALGVLAAIDSSVRLLIVPRRPTDKTRSPEFEMERKLFLGAPCATLQLRLGDDQNARQTILVAAGGGEATVGALTLAAKVAKQTEGGAVKAVFVEPRLDDVAELVGERMVKRIVSRVDKQIADVITTHVVVDDNLHKGIVRAREWGCDLLILGVERRGLVRRLFASSVSERLISEPEGPAVVVLRPAARWTSRLWGSIEQTIRDYVPQLDRRDRVDLVERIQSSSQWDFDFVALMCLSTMIATLGLLQNSVAVVIGAMLVAPLMTPLLGAGLSVVQGNALLSRTTWRTILRGFLVAFSIGCGAGLVKLLLSGVLVTEEMAARGSPGVDDLLVAFVSGLAAAYAVGRPNLLSALPGVAIAAALVPPIATSGLCLAMGQWANSWGALLLFLTNIVAIVLGAACSLWLVGVRGSHEHGGFATWAPRVALGLLAVAILLAVVESFF